MIQIKLWTWTW